LLSLLAPCGEINQSELRTLEIGRATFSHSFGTFGEIIGLAKSQLFSHLVLRCGMNLIGNISPQSRPN
jgi:hypothetical protein